LQPSWLLTPASAQPRIPDEAGNGRLTIVQWPVISIDGHELRAAPGARIFTSGNLTVTPNAVPARYARALSVERGGTGANDLAYGGAWHRPFRHE